MTTQLEQIFKKSPILKNSELIKALKSRTVIQKLKEQGTLYSYGSGYYSNKKLDPFEAKLIILNKYYPNAVVAGDAALFLHKIIDTKCPDVEVDIANSLSLKNVLFSVRRVSKERLSGVEKKSFRNFTVKTYQVEKIICLLSKDRKKSETFWSVVEKIQSKKIKINFDKVKQFDVELKTQAFKKLEKSTSERRSLQKTKSNLAEHILDTAFKMYTENGFQGVTMKMVAQRADISLAVLHRFYKSKMQLKSAIFAKKADFIIQHGYQFDEFGKMSLEPFSFIKNFSGAVLKSMDAHNGEDEFRFQAWAMLERNPIVGLIVKNSCSKAMELVANLIQQSNPKINDFDAQIRACILLLSYDSYNYLRWMYINDLNHEGTKMEFLDAYKKFIEENLGEFVLAGKK